MNFLRLNSQIWGRSRRILRTELVSLNSLACSFSSSPAPVYSLPLVRRLSKPLNPNVSIVTVLQKWIADGKNVNLYDLQNSIRQLRGTRRHKQALEISDWMFENDRFELSSGDAAIRLDLISRVHGIEAAEKYFNKISGSFSSLCDYKLYGSLLRCYTRSKQLEKAEALMQKMKDMGFVSHQLVYNEMLQLYSQMGEHKKLETLLKEMEEKGIEFNKLTYTIRLHAYVTGFDIEGMEKLLLKMEVDPCVKMDFYAYSAAAIGYLKAGLHEKALTTLKKSEQLIGDNLRKKGNYEVLLKMYATLGKKDEVYRIWGQYKQMGRFFNTGYMRMLVSLIRLDDVDGAEAIFKEWESKNSLFDIRVPNFMIGAYSKRGLLEKAEACVAKIVELGKEPNAISWENMTEGYLRENKMNKAVETVKKAILASNPGWVPKFEIMTACLDYLKSEGNNEAVDDFLKVIKEKSQFENGTSWVHLAAGYLLSGQTAEAVEIVKKAISDCKPERQIRFGTLATFLQHLKSGGDEEAAEELLMMINKHCHFARGTYNRLASFVKDDKGETKELQPFDDDSDDNEEIFA